jgi:hypothetical protein
MMRTTEAAELSLQERGILASSAVAKHLDQFSRAERRSVAGSQQPNLIARTRGYSSRGQEYTITWQDYGQPLPTWFDPLMQGFVDLLTLPLNWDSYGAGTIDPSVVQAAMDCMNAVLGPNSPAPRVVPLSSGGLQLEWHRKGIDLEIVFDPGESPSLYYRNRASGEEGDHELPKEGHLLRTIISALE